MWEWESAGRLAYGVSGHVGVGGREDPAFWWRGGNVGVGNAPGASRVGMCGRLEARGREDPAYGWRGGNVVPINDRPRMCAWKRAAVLGRPVSSLGC